MRIVLDTNVLIAAFLSHGSCAELLEYVVQEYPLFTSKFILKEFRDNMIRKFRFSTAEVLKAQRLLAGRMKVVTPIPMGARICRDRSDDQVIGTALAGKCHCIIAGDQDLLVLKEHDGIDMVSPQDFWKYEGKFKKKIL